MKITSSFSYKELGSQHSINPNNYIVNRLKNQHIFICKRGGGPGQTAVPKAGEKLNTGSHSLSKQRLTWRNCHENLCLGIKTWTVTEEFPEAQCRPLRVNSRETQSGVRHKQILSDLFPGAWSGSQRSFTVVKILYDTIMMDECHL